MSREKFIQVEALNCPKCGASLENSPSKCEFCGVGLYCETLDQKTGLERDRRFEEDLVQYMARAAAEASVEFEWGGVSAENFTLGFVIRFKEGGVSYAELSFEKARGGRGVYVMDVNPDTGHDESMVASWSGAAWLTIIPVHKKKGGSVYKVDGGGKFRFWEGAFSDEDLKSDNPQSLIGKLVTGWLVGKY